MIVEFLRHQKSAKNQWSQNCKGRRFGSATKRETDHPQGNERRQIGDAIGLAN